MWTFKTIILLYLSDALYAQPQDSEKALPVPRMHLQSQWSEVFLSEHVRLRCDLLVENWTVTWYRDEQEIQTADTSVIFSEESRSLTLKAESQTLSGNYSCKGFHKTNSSYRTPESNTVQIIVHEIPTPHLELLTPWQDVFPSETVKLGCRASSDPSDWTYQWQKDGQMMSNSDSVSFDSDGANLTISSAAASHRGEYKCRATLKSRRLITDFSNGLSLKVYDQKPRPSLIQDPEYSILFPQEPLSLLCHINISRGWEFVWYKDNTNLQVNMDKYEVPSPDGTHSGSYTCEVRRGKSHIFSSDQSQVKNVEIRQDVPEPVLSQDPDVSKVYVGEQLSLKCSLDVSIDWEYHWYKDDQMIHTNVSSITVNATHPHRQLYRCEAKRRKTPFRTTSQTRVIDFSAIPTPSLKKATQWLDVFPGEIVRLSCGMKTGASDWFYEWSKDGKPIIYEENVMSNQDGTVLTIKSSVSYTGEYSCMAKHRERPVFSNYSLGIGLQVYDAKPSVKLVQDPDVKVFHTEDNVFFSCGVNESSGWQFSWYRNNDNENPVASGPNYTIGHLHRSHSAEYKCRAKRGQGDTLFHTDPSRSVTMEVNERPSASVLLLTGWSEVFSTDSLVLKCEAEDSENKDWGFKWFKGDEEIAQNSTEKHKIMPQNDPDQSEYRCQGVRTGRPSYTKLSEPLKTKNLLLKRRVLLSISGCLVFGIFAVILGCIILRICRKPVVDQEKPEEADLFLTMAELAKHAPNPLAEYVTEEDLKDIAKEPTETVENGTICSESTPLPIAPKEDEDTSQSNNASGNGEMVSFKQ